MPEALLRDLRMHAGEWHLHPMAVVQVVKAHTRHAFVLNAEFSGTYPAVWKEFRAAQPNAPNALTVTVHSVQLTAANAAPHDGAEPDCASR